MSDLFKIATREKFRFSSNKGDLSVENLWDLPLQSKSGFDLDSVARAVNRDLKAVTEESFVAQTNPATSRLQQKLEIVKAIIAVRQAENADAVAAQVRRTELARLQEILANKKDQNLAQLSEDELQKRIAALQA